MKQAATNQSSGGRWIAILVCFFLFAMISFVTNLAAPVGTIWGSKFEWAGMAGNLMNFLAYLFMGIPAGMLLQKIGYKKLALLALATGFFGVLLQYLSGLVASDLMIGSLSVNIIIYLAGAFVGGFCVCMLNTVVNPMLNLLGGGGNRGNQLIQIGGSLNSLTATLTPLFVGVLVGKVTSTTSITSVNPLLWIAMSIFVVSFFVISFVPIQEPTNSGKVAKKKYTHSAWNFRHFVLGAIGIFFYVGIEVGIPGVLIFFLSNPEASGMSGDLAEATSIAAMYWMLMLVGRLVSSAISGKVSSKAQLIFVSCLGLLLVTVAIFMPVSIRVSMPAYSTELGFSMIQAPLSALLLVLCGLCTSVMWGGIFNLAVEGLGKYTAQASGIFMMMVVGGGVMPYIQNLIAGNSSYLASYWLVFAMLAYLFFYAFTGSRNVNKDINVEETEPADPRNL